MRDRTAAAAFEIGGAITREHSSLPPLSTSSLIPRVSSIGRLPLRELRESSWNSLSHDKEVSSY